jgi:hypothetical protein
MFFEPEECDRIVLSLQEFQLFPAWKIFRWILLLLG